MRYKIACFGFLLFFFNVSSFAQDTVIYNVPGKNLSIGSKVELLEDKAGNLTPEQVIASKNFVQKKQEVPNLQISAYTYWARFYVKNNTDAMLALDLAFATIDSVTFYIFNPDNTFDKIVSGEFIPYYKRSYKHQNYIFDLNIPKNETRVFLLRVNASEQCQLPLTIGTAKSIQEILYNADLIFGIYAGIVLIMFFYNLFIFFSVRDKTYLYYVFYILFVGLTQACVQGYAQRFFYPDSAYLANVMLIWVPALSGIFGIYFINEFLSVKKFTPLLYKILIGIRFVYFALIGLSFFNYFHLCAILVLGTAMALVIICFFIALKISLKGYRPAKFFLAAFSTFIISMVLFALKNFNVLPYNTFTYYALQIGSATEIVLLSFALADKINIFRNEKELSQAQTVQALQENERIVREQNVILEGKVNERTYELKVSNDGLNKAMTELKEAETQLVESEKMASLGQLTAGIAHEINNPINFVTSNVKPLNRDVRILVEAIAELEKIGLEGISVTEKQKKIEEYKNEIDFDYLKEEIDQLLNGIGEGASRTSEIVKGLRIFSRLDEDDLKKADINEGIESTLIITNNLLHSVIEIEKKYSNLPLVECYPGKLNQVFLNVISNAIYAIRKKFGDAEGGVLTIITESDENKVFIKIRDNGTGMDENTKKRLFEPFFTTKDVGEGTGLGLSISYNTIIKHNGQIQVNSEIGVGTEFILILPLIQK